MTVNHAQLVRTLIRRQGAMSDTQFAAKLGISASYWVLIRSGRRKLLNPSARILKFLGMRKVYVPSHEEDGIANGNGSENERNHE